MDKNSKNIDHLFREELGNYTETPPPAAWGALEQRLAAKPPAKAPFAFRRFAYIGMLVLVVAVTAVTITRKAANDQPLADNTPATVTGGMATQDAAPAANATAPNNNEHSAPAHPTQPATTIAAATATTPSEEKVTDHAAGAPEQQATPAVASTNAAVAAHAVPAAAITNATKRTTTHHTTATIAATTNNTTPVTSPSYALSRKQVSASTPAGTTAAMHTATAAKHSTKGITAQQHKKCTATQIALAANVTNDAAPTGNTQPQTAAESMANPADVDNNSTTETSTTTPVTTKAMALQAHKAAIKTPVAAAKKNAKGNTQEEVASLTTGLKQIGVTSNMGTVKEQAIPAIGTPVYNSSLNAAPELHGSNGGTPVADAPIKIIPAPVVTNGTAVRTTPKEKVVFDKWEAGIKVGYETAFSGDAATKFLASPYIQYNLSPRFALMVQPAVKTAKVAEHAVGTAQSYYKVNNDGTAKLADSTPVYILGSGQTFWSRNYAYTQTHDSVVKTNAYGGTYVELEMPLLLKYSISPKFAVYAGANVTYSKLMNVTEHTYTSDPITLTGNARTIAPQTAAAPAIPAISTAIAYTGNAYSTYSGPQYTGTTGNALRLGYMAGITYNITDKWMVDGLVQQGIAKQDLKDGNDINKAISSAYFRFTIGYKLTK